MKIYDKLYILISKIPNYKLVDINDWDIEEAKAIVSKIDGAYAFRFQRRGWEEIRSAGRYDIESKMIKESGTHYLNGYVETLEDIQARIELNRDETRIKEDQALLQKLIHQNAKAVVRSIDTNKWCMIFDEEVDILLD